MPIHVGTQPVPLVVGDDDVVRARGTRVTLDSLVVAFRGGATAEEIAQQYPAVALADVYAIVAFYLGHQADVDAYVEEGNLAAERLRLKVEQQFSPSGIRDRLLARRSRGQTGRDAAPGS